MNTIGRPLIQDIVKSAMDRTTQRAKIAEEGARQLRHMDGDEPGSVESKIAGEEVVSTEYAHKLAAAVEYVLPHVKNASTQGPEGVSESQVSGQLPGPGGYGHAHHQPPMTPGAQKGLPKEQGATQMENTLHSHVPGTQQLSITGGKGKTASADVILGRNLARLQKMGSKAAPVVVPPVMDAKQASLVGAFEAHIKAAADENNPAKISAGAAVPPDSSAAGEPGGAPAGGMPVGPRGLVHSNEAAINFKRSAAYAPRKGDLKAYLSEPALTSSTDSTLQAAFAHTGEAGTKLASEQTDKVAAAREILSKIVDRAQAQ